MFILKFLIYIFKLGIVDLMKLGDLLIRANYDEYNVQPLLCDCFVYV